MSRAFFDASTKKAITAAVREVESKTAAELVALVRWESSNYRDTDFAVGFCVSVVTLMALLYLPHEFPLWVFVVDVPVSFAIGSLLSMTVIGVRRMLTQKTRMEKAVRRAAHAEFYEQGISRTSGRWGVLVYVSAFEHCVEVVPDIGIDVEALGTQWRTAIDALRSAVEQEDVDRFVAVLRTLGPVLGSVLPHRDGDVDELGDEADVDESKDSERPRAAEV